MKEWREVFHGKRTVVLMTTGGPLETNSYVIARDFTLKAVVDPFSPDILRELKVHKRIGLPNEVIVIFTHLHPDHVSYLNPMDTHTGEPIKFRYMCHPADLNFKYAFEVLGKSMGIETYYPSNIEPVPIMEWDLLKELKLEIRHTPGHSPGSISLILREGPVEVAIVGDLIFKETIGRWDLPGGDANALSISIRDLLRSLREDALILPGHGPVTTVEDELKHNPFVREIMGMSS